MQFGLPIGGHVFFYATIPDPESGVEKEVARKYTPTSEVNQKGYCEFIIKVYHANEHPKFPHGGLMTQYLEKMEIGKYLKIEGPKGKLNYKGCGNFYISKKYEIKKRIGMIAGGSGITPMFQIIQAVVKNKDKVRLFLLFGNKSESDILIREELEQLQEDYSDRFTLAYIIDKAEHPDTWKHETGYITKEILEKHMPKANDDTIILTCGPPVMNNLVKQFLPNHLVHEF
jgi:nitrate reductase (NAD(P)H)